MLKILLVVVLVVVVAATALYIMRSRSVLYRFVESGDPAGEPGFSIFNPLRDRIPETYAESFLDLVKAGKCQEAMSSLPVEEEYRHYICEMEREHPLASWRLKNRTDRQDTVKMFYWHWSKEAKAHSWLWVTVQKSDEGWHVTSYERHY
jgi:hypothetical protein